MPIKSDSSATGYSLSRHRRKQNIGKPKTRHVFHAAWVKYAVKVIDLVLHHAGMESVDPDPYAGFTFHCTSNPKIKHGTDCRFCLVRQNPPTGRSVEDRVMRSTA